MTSFVLMNNLQVPTGSSVVKSSGLYKLYTHTHALIKWKTNAHKFSLRLVNTDEVVRLGMEGPRPDRHEMTIRETIVLDSL